jgi:uncharacterized cofD-like protein
VPGVRQVVALGGGHGLSVSLRALRHLGCSPTGIVGTGDDGGSSGRLRELGVPPPGDLRMALAALAEDELWHRVIQHRFAGAGDLGGHALGNLMLVALWEETGDIVAGLDHLGSMLGIRGRVLPNCLEPVQVVADVTTIDGRAEVIHGQAALTTLRGRIDDLRLLPQSPPACPEAVSAIREASDIVIGPGSWFTSVLPHVLIPDIAASLRATDARRILVLNASPQPGETEGFTASSYLDAWARHAPGIPLDVVVADPTSVTDPESLESAARRLGAEVVSVKVLARPDVHDAALLGAALEATLAGAP